MRYLTKPDSSAEPFFQKPVVLDQALFRMVLAAHTSVEREDARLEQEGHLYRALLVALTRYADTRFEAKPTSDPALVRALKRYLQDHFSENVTLSDLAQVARLSPPYLLTVFTKAVGMSPHRYLTSLRIERAKTLLQRGAAIADVAVAVGYVDQSHLHRHFKRLVQVTPGAYRRAFQAS